MRYYTFHIGDYIGHTVHLTDEQDLAYRRMLDFYFLSEQPFEDVEFLARRVRSTPETVIAILREFFTECDDGWRNKRADEEIAKYHQAIESARKAGRASAQRRLNNRSTTVEPTIYQEPFTNNQEKEKAKATCSRVPESVNARPKTENAVEPDDIGHDAPGVDKPPHGIPPTLWRDFLTLWTKSRKTLTNTALAEMRREAKKAGWTLRQVLERCCRRGQISFEAAWVAGDSSQEPERPRRWQDSVTGVKEKGVELNIPWRAGTTIGQYTKILEDHINGRGA